ncbi:MAG: hypothetical protein IAF08_06670 [Rhizobacter sp.]|nr:hypothetical protein [Chlorobiales bacterium]
MHSITKTLRYFFGRLFKTTDIETRLARMQEALGRIETRQLASETNFFRNEFRVSSQWGEDGLIQYLVRHVAVDRKVFVEFGTEDYRESNTRFLLTNNQWSGLLIDGSEANINVIRKDDIYWQYNLKAVQAFITRDNINRLLTENGITGDIGLLSIDVDGNDYWIWKAIDAVRPAIVVVEYNYRFGKDRAVTIPYREDFVRTMHPSMIYFGASLKAFWLLGKQKGYAFVGTNSTGLNAFFVRKDKLPAVLKEKSFDEDFTAGHYRGLFNDAGVLQFVSPEEEMQYLAQLPVVDVEKDFTDHAPL